MLWLRKMIGLGSEKNIFVFPRKYRHADSLAQSSPQILKSGLKRIKLICTSENESKDQIGDSRTIFATVLHKDANKFCLSNKGMKGVLSNLFYWSESVKELLLKHYYSKFWLPCPKNLSFVFVTLWQFWKATSQTAALHLFNWSFQLWDDKKNVWKRESTQQCHVL